MNDTTEISVSINRVTKKYGSFTALNDITLDIRDNEFFTLLGPSGCGKTTLLRTIAGFEDVTEGSIQLYGQDIATLPPSERPVNTVFQNYALFPHMDVTQNIMYGLQRLKLSSDKIKKRTAEVLELVQLGEYSKRFPAQLSGGQQQRVALARALAPSPKVLLLDEPLSALDLKLRQSVRLELQQLQQDTGITFVFVTHDQEEALTMSDRIAVISAGELQQIGTPREIYELPQNRVVAEFIGETNLVDVQVESISDGKAICILPGNVKLTCQAAEGAHVADGHISIRPERIQIVKAGEGDVQGVITRQVYLGTDLHIFVRLDDGEIMTVRLQNTKDGNIPGIGDTVGLDLEADMTRLLVD